MIGRDDVGQNVLQDTTLQDSSSTVACYAEAHEGITPHWWPSLREQCCKVHSQRASLLLAPLFSCPM